jgi:hypothetical protein
MEPMLAEASAPMERADELAPINLEFNSGVAAVYSPPLCRPRSL